MNDWELTKGWVTDDKEHLLHGNVPLDKFVEKGTGLILQEGHGLMVKDIYGKEYIDALGGAVCVNIGYSRRELAEAAEEQMMKLSYSTSWSDETNTAAIEFGHELAKFTPEGLKRFFFANSGSEANESAYKLARFYWGNKGKAGKYKIISRQLAYHGLNLASMSATGMERFWKGVEPLVSGFVHIPAPYCYRCPFGKEYPDCGLDCAEALAKKIDEEERDTVSAFVAEPIYGVGGTILPPPEYWSKVREICTEYEVLLILDEVMTGFGRTGKNFACEHWGIKPDLLLMSKGITSSALPLSAVALSDDVFQGMIGPNPFPHLYTCGAHPVCCAVAKANLEILLRENLVENSAKVGQYLLARLRELEEFPYIGEVRGLGLFTAFEVVEDKATKSPFDSKLGVPRKLVAAAKERGLLIRATDTSVQVAPPLIATTDDIDHIMGILKPVVAELPQIAGF